jgi:hypothetical protein
MVMAGHAPDPSGRNSQAPNSTRPSAGSLTSSFEIMSIFLANLIANRCDKCLLHDQSPLCVVMTGV